MELGQSMVVVMMNTGDNSATILKYYTHAARSSHAPLREEQAGHSTGAGVTNCSILP